MKRKHKILLCLGLLALVLTACGKGEPVHADLADVYGQLSFLPEAGELSNISEKRIRRVYGIDPERCIQLVMAESDSSLRCDEIWLLEAGSDETAEELSALARSRVHQLCRELKDYLPEQYTVAQKARVLHIGRYVGLFISPASEEMAKQFKKAVGG